MRRSAATVSGGGSGAASTRAWMWAMTSSPRSRRRSSACTVYQRHYQRLGYAEIRGAYGLSPLCQQGQPTALSCQEDRGVATRCRASVKPPKALYPLKA